MKGNGYTIFRAWAGAFTCVDKFREPFKKIDNSAIYTKSNRCDLYNNYYQLKSTVFYNTHES